MDRLASWIDLGAVVVSVYRKIGGRPPIELMRMQRPYPLRRWFGLSDPALEAGL
jgi:hypothetical protein